MIRQYVLDHLRPLQRLLDKGRAYPLPRVQGSGLPKPLLTRGLQVRIINLKKDLPKIQKVTIMNFLSNYSPKGEGEEIAFILGAERDTFKQEFNHFHRFLRIRSILNRVSDPLVDDRRYKMIDCSNDQGVITGAYQEAKELPRETRRFD